MGVREPKRGPRDLRSWLHLMRWNRARLLKLVLSDIVLRLNGLGFANSIRPFFETSAWEQHCAISRKVLKCQMPVPSTKHKKSVISNKLGTTCICAPNQDLGAAYFDKLEQHRVERRLVTRLEQLDMRSLCSRV